MKKKGFTIIEIIVSIALISLIGLTSIVLINKNKKTKEKLQVEYQEKIRLASNIYFEKNYNSNLHNIVYDFKGRAYIKLGDLVDTGLVASNLDNPYKNQIVEETKDECVRVYINEDDQFEIEYPIDEEKIECKNEIITEEKKESYIYVEDGPIKLPSSNDTLEILLDKLENRECLVDLECFFYIKEEYKNGEYVKNNFVYKLIDSVTGEEIEVSEDDWIIDVTYDEEKNLFLVTYSIKETSEVFNYYSDIYNNGKSAEVYLVDDDAPILINIDSYLEYGDGIDDYITLVNKLGIYNSAEYFDVKDYVVFDNYDGFSSLLSNYYLLEDDDPQLLHISKIEKISYDNVSIGNNVSIKDTVSISRNYNVNYKVDIAPLTIYYNGPHTFYKEFVDDYFLNDYIFSTPKVGNSMYYYQEYYYTLCTKTLPKKCFYSDLGFEEIEVGDYELSINVWDSFGDAISRNVKYIYDNTITILYFEDIILPDYETTWELGYCELYPFDVEMGCAEPEYGYEEEDVYCGDACIIADMKKNSAEWYNTSSESHREVLHNANVALSKKLSYSTTYNSHTGTYNTSSGPIYTNKDL